MTEQRGKPEADKWAELKGWEAAEQREVAQVKRETEPEPSVDDEFRMGIL